MIRLFLHSYLCRSLVAVATCTVASMQLAGCASTESQDRAGAVEGANLIAPPLPSYREIADRWNDRVKELTRLRSSVGVRIRYKDESGEIKEEQPDGILQVIRPDRVALSLSKAGERLFWFGCDENRYWWFDFNNGRHAKVGSRAAQTTESLRANIGVALSPWDLILLLGTVPVPTEPELERASSEHAMRCLRWADDLKHVVLIAPTRTSSGTEPNTATTGFVEYTMNPADAFPSSIRILDADSQPIVTALLEGEERVDITRPGFGSARPRMPGLLHIQPHNSDTHIRLRLASLTDARVSDRAFSFDELVKEFELLPEEIENLDPPTTTAPESEPSSISTPVPPR